MRRQVESTHGCIAVGLLLGMALAAPVRAVDGVIEISQAKVKVGGVTPGDTPLFPVTISQPGSYRLTSNLDVTDASARPNGTAAENTTAIQVTAADVTIDLNGFMIKGPTVCSGHPPTCSPEGLGEGIAATDHDGVAVLNGTVRGMGYRALTLGDTLSRAENVRVVSNGGYGIRAATVTNCTADSNGSTGIILATTVTNSVATSNSGPGILATTVKSCTANSNAGSGISGFLSPSSVTNCTANSNRGPGIFATTVANCMANSNGGTGIDATTVTGCTANGNGGDQVHAPGITGQNMCGDPATPCP